GNDVVGVDGVKRRAGGKQAFEIGQNVPNVLGQCAGRSLAQRSGNAEFEVEGGEVDSQLVAPDLEHADLVAAAGRDRVEDVLREVGLDRTPASREPELVHVAGHRLAPAGYDVDGNTLQHQRDRDVSPDRF